MATAPLAGVRRMEFDGDFRGFSPFSSQAKRFRTEQEFDIDFNSRTILYRGSTGLTRVKITWLTGRVSQYVAQAKDSCLTFSEETWGPHSVTFRAKSACANPLLPGAPSADYDFRIRVWKGGQVQVVGRHDGYPAYEVYKRIKNVFTSVYLFDPNDKEQSMMSLFPPMEFSVNATQ
jgi:hypothetical protein